MDDTFTCDWCGQNLAIDRRGDAVVVKCPKCGKSLMVPPVPVQTKTMQTATANAAKPALSLAAPPATPSAAQTKQCPFCGKPMGQETEVCKSCGFTPASWDPQGTAEKEPTTKRKFSANLLVILGLTAIALLGIAIYVSRVSARK
jgi:ribosomal protein L37AE/L43A